MTIDQNNIKYTDTTRSKLTIEKLQFGNISVRVKINPDDVINQDRIVSMCKQLFDIVRIYKFTKLKGSFKLSKRTGLYRINLRDEIIINSKTQRVLFSKLVENDHVNKYIKTI